MQGLATNWLCHWTENEISSHVIVRYNSRPTKQWYKDRFDQRSPNVLSWWKLRGSRLFTGLEPYGLTSFKIFNKNLCCWREILFEDLHTSIPKKNCISPSPLMVNAWLIACLAAEILVREYLLVKCYPDKWEQ